jgi:hypothetical protein
LDQAQKTASDSTGSHAKLFSEASRKIFGVIEPTLISYLGDIHQTGLSVVHNHLMGYGQTISAYQFRYRMAH